MWGPNGVAGKAPWHLAGARRAILSPALPLSPPPHVSSSCLCASTLWTTCQWDPGPLASYVLALVRDPGHLAHEDLGRSRGARSWSGSAVGSGWSPAWGGVGSGPQGVLGSRASQAMARQQCPPSGREGPTDIFEREQQGVRTLAPPGVSGEVAASRGQRVSGKGSERTQEALFWAEIHGTG